MDRYFTQAAKNKFVELAESFKTDTAFNITGDRTKYINEYFSGGGSYHFAEYISSELKSVDRMPSPTAKYIPAKDSHDTGSWDKSCTLVVTASEYKTLQGILNPRTENLPYDPESFKRYSNFIARVKTLKADENWVK